MHPHRLTNGGPLTAPRGPAMRPVGLLVGLLVGLGGLLLGCGSGGSPTSQDGGCYNPDAGDLCNGTEGPQAACVALPDAGVISDPASVASVAVPPFDQEVARLYDSDDGLPADEIRALATTAEGTLYAGTAAGLARLDQAQDPPRFTPIAGTPGTTPVTALARATGTESVVVGLPEAVGFLRDGAWEDEVAVPGGGVQAVAQDGSTTWIGTTSGLWHAAGTVVTADDTVTAGVTALLVESPGAILAGTASGLYRGGPGAFTLVPGLPSDEIRALAHDVSGKVLVGTAAGVAVLEGGAVVETLTGGPGALPFDDVTAVAVGDDGLRLVGFARGAARPRGDAWHLYLSRRWTPADQTTAVAILQDALYLGTPAGVGEITTVPMTLADKAAVFVAASHARHIRMDGFVTTSTRLVDPDDLSQGTVSRDEDNDGLWTQMHIGALCLGYAATGDTTLRDQARRSLANMFLQIDVPAAGNPGIDGFVARSLVREDETALWEQKSAAPERWRGPVDYQGHRYLWKNDTSSDEVVGHYFGYGLYYDLCAEDEDERQEIRDRVARLTDYILEGCFYLIDEDGEATMWGKWGPEYTNHGIASKFGPQGLQAAEIISHLRVAYHIVGDPRYQQAYEYLIQAHGYDDNIRHAYDYMKSLQINHSDDELLFLSYYPLLRYEPDPVRRASWEEGVAGSYDGDPWGERPERNPLFAFIYAYALGSGPAVERALADAERTLREYPLDLREYRVDNTGRLDYEVHPDDDRFEELQLTTVPPYDEKSMKKWNANPYRIVDGGDEVGSSEMSGSHWLLAYYLGLYHGFISE